MSFVDRSALGIAGEPMTNSDIQRVRRPATAEEGEKLAKYHEQVAQDLPDRHRQAQTAETEL